MTLEELKKIHDAFMRAEKVYKALLEKHFPTTWSHRPVKVTPITREVIHEITKLRKVRDKKETEWHNAIIKYSNSRK